MLFILFLVQWCCLLIVVNSYKIFWLVSATDTTDAVSVIFPFSKQFFLVNVIAEIDKIDHSIEQWRKDIQIIHDITENVFFNAVISKTLIRLYSTWLEV